MANHKNTVADFESLFDRSDTCWNWTGTVWATGYGRFIFNGKSWKAHRLAWSLYVAELADRDCVLHRCDNRKCVNPKHLFLGTRADNNRDKVNKNRQSRGGAVHTAKLTRVQVLQIRGAIGTSKEIAELFGITWGHVNKIKGKRTWAHV